MRGLQEALAPHLLGDAVLGAPPVCLNCYAARKEDEAGGDSEARPLPKPYSPKVSEARPWEVWKVASGDREPRPMLEAKQVRYQEAAILAAMPPDDIDRAFNEAEIAEESMRDSMNSASRRELDRELGDSRALHLESFVPTSARQRSVQACLQKVIDLSLIHI